jgi:hypothetical protein
VLKPKHLGYNWHYRNGRVNWGLFSLKVVDKAVSQAVGVEFWQDLCSEFLKLSQLARNVIEGMDIIISHSLLHKHTHSIYSNIQCDFLLYTVVVVIFK